MHNARFFQDFCGAKQFVCILTRRVVSERPLVNDQLKAIWSEIQARLVAFAESRDGASSRLEECGCVTCAFRRSAAL
jgi:hypothetical protein